MDLHLIAEEYQSFYDIVNLSLIILISITFIIAFIMSVYLYKGSALGRKLRGSLWYYALLPGKTTFRTLRA